MTLEELAQLALPVPPLRVPAWALGCFKRRAITYFTGVTDTTTHVIWLQSHGLTADLRLAPDRPRLGWETANLDELGALAQAEGGLASTLWDGARMSWRDWTAFQLHDKWPEPAELRRVGDCLIEFAPSGAYVEDWRLLPSAPGLLVGLRLIQERDLAAQEIRHRGGGLLVAGDHAMLIRGRPAPLPVTSRLPDLVRQHVGNKAALRGLFAFEAAYARGNVVALSTNPLREGGPLMRLDGFRYEAESGLVLQNVLEDSVRLERRFRADTLRADFKSVPETPATDEAKAWLARERATLLASS